MFLVWWQHWAAPRFLVWGAVSLLATSCVNPELKNEAVMPTDAATAIVDPEAFSAARLAAVVFAETNRHRVEHGLRELDPYPRLRRAASLQAGINALTGEVSHFNPLNGRAAPHDRVRAAGVIGGSVGENVLMSPVRVSPTGSGEVYARLRDGRTEWRDVSSDEELAWPTYAELGQRLVQQWMDSPGHRANILSPQFKYLACDVARGRTLQRRELIYAVQVFMGSRPRRESL